MLDTHPSLLLPVGNCVGMLPPPQRSTNRGWCLLVFEFVEINGCVLQIDTTARDGIGGHRCIVLSMPRRRWLPVPISIVTNISEARTGEMLCLAVKRRKPASRGSFHAGGVMWLQQGDQFLSLATILTHQFLPRTDHNDG